MGSSISAQTKKIELSGKSLKEISEAKNVDKARVAEALEVVDLSKNKISEVPESILSNLHPNSLHTITEVILRRNKLTSFPTALFKLLSLKIIDLSENEITSIPDDITDFYRLEELLVADNKLTKLPWFINRIKKLKVLSIQNNEIKYLPTLLTELPSLELFEYSNNPLDTWYGPPRAAADEILSNLAKQKVPSIYTDDVAKYIKEKPIKSSKRIFLRNLLRFKEGIAAFEAYCAKELHVENVHFFTRVRKFMQTFRSTRDIRHPDLIMEATAIFEQFIRLKAPQQLNFGFEIMNKFLFDDIFEKVCEYLEDDVLGRFRADEANKVLVKRVKKFIEKKQEKKASIYGRQVIKVKDTDPKKSKKSSTLEVPKSSNKGKREKDDKESQSESTVTESASMSVSFAKIKK